MVTGEKKYFEFRQIFVDEFLRASKYSVYLLCEVEVNYS